MKSLAILIPLYNEAEIIDTTINEWLNLNFLNDDYDILFIDDGSLDNSVKIIKDYQLKNDNILLLQKKNQGHGKALLYGYNFVIDKNYKYIFQTDSDNQFKSFDLKKLWLFKDNDYDLIIGNRKKRNDPLLRVILSKLILRPIIYLMFRKYIIDPNIPYRLINRKYLKNFLDIVPKNSNIPNILMSIMAHKIKTINIEHYPRKHGEINWNAIKLFKFGFHLLNEVFIFKKILKKLK